MLLKITTSGPHTHRRKLGLKITSILHDCPFFLQVNSYEDGSWERGLRRGERYVLVD